MAQESSPQPEENKQKMPLEAQLYLGYAKRRLNHDNEFGAYVPGMSWPLTLLHDRAQRIRNAVLPLLLTEMQDRDVEGVVYQRSDVPEDWGPKRADVDPQLYVAITQRNGELTGAEPRGDTGQHVLEVGRVAGGQIQYEQ